MVLLHAAAQTLDRSRIIVATFDHGTGPAARAAVERVRSTARDLRIEVVAGAAARTVRPTEAAWRAARWTFLRDVAAQAGGVVATAHTLNDQIETVLMRVLRGAGARGLAGLFAESSDLHPLIELRRGEIAAYAAAHGVEWVEDPSNTSLAFLRNRLRLELLPALERADPTLERDLLRLSRTAAAWRAE